MRAPWAFVLDVVGVLIFIMIGRRAHAESDAVQALLTTAAPFLLALVVGWLASRAGHLDPAQLRGGTLIWAVTLAGGMVLRAAFGQGTAPAFIAVAAVSLAALLLGWRTVALLVSRRSRERESAGNSPA